MNFSYNTLNPRDALGDLNEVELKNAPDILYMSGDEALLKAKTKISIVGTRKPSDEGCKRTRSLVKKLVENDIIIVSGLALGVDTIAHTTAIETGGKTITVLGTPLDTPYPANNKNLLEEIEKNHLAISQFPSGMTFQRKNFPMRNRTMALISDATIIIEAGEKSGTRHQGWEALRLGRPLFLLASLVENQELTWPKEMLSYGAEILTRDNLETVINNLPDFSAGEEVDF